MPRDIPVGLIKTMAGQHADGTTVTAAQPRKRPSDDRPRMPWKTPCLRRRRGRQAAQRAEWRQVDGWRVLRKKFE